MKVWCLFEQSGTFKNVFKEFGYEAYDCDILNDFKQTDFQVDLFLDIWREYEMSIIKNIDDLPHTIFDKISKDDLVFAFFPCIKFTEKSFLNASCKGFFMRKFNDLKRLEYSRQSINEISRYYTLLCKLCEIAIHKGFKLIIENPNANMHFLKLYFPFKPTITIKDRSKYGDFYKKPTNFWFFNFKPSYNFIFENIEQTSKPICYSLTEFKRKKTKQEEHEAQVRRSLISPLFAKRFIMEFILNADELELKKH